MKNIVLFLILVITFFLTSCPESPKPHKRLLIKPESAVMFVGESMEFSAGITGLDTTATEKDIIWKASCGSTSKLSSTKVKYSAPNTAGTCKLTASAGRDLQDSVNILVQKKAGNCHDPVNIPDINLQKLIKEKLKINRAISCSDLESLTSLKLKWVNQRPENETIVSLQGLEYAINLKYINLAVTKVKDLSPLTKLLNLTSLTIYRGEVEDIKPLSALLNLTSLDLSVNNIQDLSPISGLKNLKKLYLDSNEQMQNLNKLQNLTTLEVLSLGGNNITDISFVAKLKLLSSLTLWGSKIADISPLQGLKNLSYLRIRLDNDKTTDISVLAGLSKLWFLELGGNKHMSNINSLRALSNLTKFYLDTTDISDIGFVAKLSKLQTLSLNHNKVVDISSLKSLADLKYVYLRDNLIKSITALADNPGLSGNSDKVYLNENCLDTSTNSQSMKDINQLKQRGVEVVFDNQKTVCK